MRTKNKRKTPTQRIRELKAEVKAGNEYIKDALDMYEKARQEVRELQAFKDACIKLVHDNYGTGGMEMVEQKMNETKYVTKQLLECVNAYRCFAKAQGLDDREIMAQYMGQKPDDDGERGAPFLRN